MQFKIKAFKPNYDKYNDDEITLAYHFSKDALKEFGKFLKAIVIFGSLARQKLPEAEQKKIHDIDLLLIIDDVSVVLSQELMEAYDLISKKLAKKISPRIHLTTLTFTAFWEFVKVGDPLVINILRDGMPIFDTGFFTPLQKLLFQGRIRPTEESIWAYFSRAPRTLTSARWHLLQGVIDLYWACIDAAHAALMRLGEIPPSPDHVADLLQEKMVKQKLLDKHYVHVFRNFYKIQKMITHREISSITGQEFERYYHDAEEFVKVMEEFIDKQSHLPHHQR